MSHAEDSGVVVLDEAGRVMFASALCSKVEADALVLRLGPGAVVVDAEELRSFKRRMMTGANYR